MGDIHTIYISRFRNQYTRKRNHHSRLSISFYGASEQQLVSGVHFDGITHRKWRINRVQNI